jgi:nitroreductase
MELADVIRITGSTRHFRPDPVRADLIYRVLDNARFAPSGANRQPWRVIVVTDPQTRAQLGSLYRRSWYELHAPLRQAPGEPIEPDYYSDHMDDVPVQLIVGAELAALTTGLAALDGSRIVGGATIYPFVQNILLGLRDAGLGGTLSTVVVPVEDEVKKLLNIPDGFLVAAHIGVGWPARPFPTRLVRKPVREFATADRFDGPPLEA